MKEHLSGAQTFFQAPNTLHILPKRPKTASGKALQPPPQPLRIPQLLVGPCDKVVEDGWSVPRGQVTERISAKMKSGTEGTREFGVLPMVNIFLHWPGPCKWCFFWTPPRLSHWRQKCPPPRTPAHGTMLPLARSPSHSVSPDPHSDTTLGGLCCAGCTSPQLLSNVTPEACDGFRTHHQTTKPADFPPWRNIGHSRSHKIVTAGRRRAQIAHRLKRTQSPSFRCLSTMYPGSKCTSLVFLTNCKFTLLAGSGYAYFPHVPLGST